MLVIRLFRVGKKNQPSFKIVVTDRRKPPRAGRFVEQVGFYNPLTKEKALKEERIKHWLSVGAKPSDTIYNMLVSEKIIEGKKIAKHKESKKKEEHKEEEPVAEETAEKVEKKEESAAPVEKKTTEETEKENSKQDPVVSEEKKEKGD